MNRIIGNPARYIQGAGILEHLCEYAGILGNNLLIIADERVKDAIYDSVQKSIETGDGSVRVSWEPFGGQCCDREIDRIADNAKNEGYDVIAGAGGGKALDTAKAVADKLGVETLCIPTIAATDAPCLAGSVVYTDQDTVQEYRVYKKNPAIVLADSAVICRAPARFFAAGIGDCLSTLFEARACIHSNTPNVYGSSCSRTSEALAALSMKVIRENGYKAYLAVKNNICNQAVEDVIEANIYLSGIAAEGAGSDAGCHAIYNALTSMEETRGYNHGEMVSFGVFVQLVLENENLELIRDLQEFCTSVDLPITLRQIGVPYPPAETDSASTALEDKLHKVAELAAEDTLQHMPFEVTPEDTYYAILMADALGREYLEQNG